jgi:hypothetical protein
LNRALNFSEKTPAIDLISSPFPGHCGDLRCNSRRLSNLLDQEHRALPKASAKDYLAASHKLNVGTENSERIVMIRPIENRHQGTMESRSNSLGKEAPLG